MRKNLKEISLLVYFLKSYNIISCCDSWNIYYLIRSIGFVNWETNEIQIWQNSIGYLLSNKIEKR